MIDLTWTFQSTLQICPPPRCAGWARNPKGPQITPFCHQMGRHPTIWDFKTGIRHRIPARISPWGSRGPNPNFFRVFWTPKCPKIYFLGGFRIYPRPIAMDLGPQGPKGPTGGPWGGPRGPLGAPRGPLGPPGPPGGPARPPARPPGGPLGGSKGSLGAHGAPGQGRPRGPGAQGAQVAPVRGRPRVPGAQGAHGAPVRGRPRVPGAQGDPWASPRSPLGPLGPLLGGAREGSLHWL